METKKNDKYFIINQQVKKVYEYFKNEYSLTKFSGTLDYQVSHFKKVLNEEILVNSIAIYKLIIEFNVNPYFLFGKSDTMFLKEDLERLNDELKKENEVLKKDKENMQVLINMMNILDWEKVIRSYKLEKVKK